MQSAYWKNHSCETAILRVHNDIMCALADRKIVALMLFYMTAAFDTVDHLKLCDILQHMGIKDSALTWFTSYLQDRRQLVTV